MKRIIKKTSIFILIALFAVCTLMGMTSGSIFAEAKDTTLRANVTLSDNLDGKGLIKGKSFILTLTITATDTSLWFDGFNLYVAPIKSETGTQELDYDVANKLSGVTDQNTGKLVVERPETSLTFDSDAYGNTSSTDYFRNATANGKGTCLFGVSWVGGNTTANRVYASEAVTLSTEITVDKTIEADQLILSVYTGLNSSGKALGNSISVNDGTASSITYTPTGNAVKDKGRFETNVLVIPLKDETEDNSLESLEVGPAADALTAVDMTVEKPTYTVNTLMDQMVVKPVAGAPDLATVKVGVTDSTGTIDVAAPVDLTADGTVTLNPRPSHGQKIKITVTSQKGDPADYFVDIVISYARLVALTSDVAPEDGTTLGFQETIGSDGLATLFAYTLHVPTVQDVQLTPTVLADYGISETIAVAVTSGGTVAGATVNSGTATTVTMTDATCVVTLTLTAADETTTQDYTITILSTDVSITTFTLTGDSGTVYNNDANMATGSSVDYFFSVDKETTVQGKMTIVAATGATIQVEGSDYNADTVYAKGEYSVTITAVAGNFKVYKVKINAPEFLELKDESYYQFLIEYEEDGFFYRIAYGELPDYDMDELEHGVNDSDVSTFVLGQIKPMTSLEEFFNHIKSPLTYIQLCVMFEDGEEYALFDRGEYAEEGYEEELICTGYYIKFGSGEVPSEIIYLSVLGDVDGDGYANALDGTFMQNVMREVVLLTDLPIEVRLAGYLNDAGEWNATTYTVMSNIAREAITPEDLYWYPEGYEFPDTLSNVSAFAAAPVMILAEEAEEVVVTEVATEFRLAANTEESSGDTTEEPTNSGEPVNNQPAAPSKKYGYTDWDIKEKTL